MVLVQGVGTKHTKQVCAGNLYNPSIHTDTQRAEELPLVQTEAVTPQDLYEGTVWLIGVVIGLRERMKQGQFYRIS
ncbi:hypothetical protein INR49_008812 [Caranx melampygus]|nr:hypothetical protein INR49_008812 [Caranx melampygus]